MWVKEGGFGEGRSNEITVPRQVSVSQDKRSFYHKMALQVLELFPADSISLLFNLVRVIVRRWSSK